MDIGCGVGTWLKGITASRVVGVDAHMPTAKVAMSACPHATVICCNMSMLTSLFPPDCVECITAMDSIEHLPREDALAALKDFELLASKQIMLFVPTGNHPQEGDRTNLGNVHFQQHRSTWQAADFAVLGYEIHDYPAYHNMPGKDRGAVVAIKKLGA